MKATKTLTFILTIILCSIFSCSKKEEITNTNKQVKNETDHNSDSFNIENIPVSNVNFSEFGEFPHIGIPENVKFTNSPLENETGEIYFPIGKKNDFVKLTGKTFKAFLSKKDNDTKDWSVEEITQNFDDNIKKLGGVLIFNGKLTNEQTDYLNNNDKTLGEEGSIDYWNEPVRVYAIRSAKGDNIYVQLSLNSASGAIQILQEKSKNK
ncbi:MULTISPECIES: hypothetical protein [unclassified Empedobacter]|uniref:hypothetical protein n=1 Tax=unclassified Empedobacter TaxID=2643773 RepID=UPI0025B8A4A8|nr:MULTISPECIES: hypothetical protein [unclassified Empedobacter]